MRLTLLHAKEALRHKAPEDRLEFRINRACERLMLSGKFSGSMHRLALTAPYGQLTLPRHYRTIEGVKVDGYVYDIANHWYEFLPGRSDAFGYSLSAVRDLGDGHATIYDLPVGDNLTIDTTATDMVVTIYGTDVNALPIVATVSRVASVTTPIANTFANIDRVHKEQTAASVRLYHVAADTTQTNLAIMAPTEEETYYRRYMIDTLTSEVAATVVALAKLRHIEFTSDQDVLPFTNISALEAMMDSLQYRAENDVTLANQYETDAIDILNKELKDTNAESSFPVMRFFYPGHTQPNFRGHY